MTAKRRGRWIGFSSARIWLTAWLVVLPCCSAGDLHSRLPEPTAPSVGVPLNAGASGDTVVLIGAGDIAECKSTGAQQTAALIDSLLAEVTVPTWIITLGDNAYPRGTVRDWTECYEPTWGRFRHITRPVPGNHDYKNGQLLGFLPFFGNAHPYFAYFDLFPGQAGKPDEGWYRYRHGSWDVFALNSGKDRHIKPGTGLWNWLDDELSKPGLSDCSIAYYHYPRFSMGKHGDAKKMRDGWELLAGRGVDILLVGHDHNYQSFRPQSPDGRPDPHGMRQFVVGTGGAALRTQAHETAGALHRWTAEHFGVMKLTLGPGRYAWEFISEDGQVWDSGTSPCQNAGS